MFICLTHLVSVRSDKPLLATGLICDYFIYINYFIYIKTTQWKIIPFTHPIWNEKDISKCDDYYRIHLEFLNNFYLHTLKYQTYKNILSLSFSRLQKLNENSNIYSVSICYVSLNNFKLF